MNKATPQAIAHLHSVFCAATGFELKLRLCDYEREFAYVQFINAGFTADDINTVVRYLKRKIAAGERQPGSLKWSNTIGAINRFEEDLCMAKAELRNTKPQATPKQRVLEQAHPTIVPMTPDQGKDTSQPIGRYLEALRRAAQ